MDYRAAVEQLIALASPVMPVGDVIPFGKRSMYPNLGTEGAGRVGNTRGETPLNQWLYERGVPAHKIGQALELQRQHGLSDAAIKYQRLLYEQQKAQEQAALDKRMGISQELRDAFMRASRTQPENQD